MKRLYGLVTFGWIVLFALSGTTVGLGRLSTTTGNLPELQACGQQICLYGIQPKKTTLDTAQAIIRNTSILLFVDTSLRTVYKQAPPYYRMELLVGATGETEANSKLIGEMDLTLPGNQASFNAGMMLAQYGPPCGILHLLTYTQIALIYPGMVLIFGADQPYGAHRLQYSSSLQEVSVFANADSCKGAIATYKADPWRGFTKYSTRK